MYLEMTMGQSHFAQLKEVYQLDYDFYSFDGGHNIEESVLKKLI